MQSETYNPGERYGKTAQRPYAIPPRGWWRVLRHVWRQSQRDHITVIAAGCAFFAVFALFPAISTLVSLYVFVADPATVEAHLGLVQPLLPAQAYDILLEQTQRIVRSTGLSLEWGLVASFALMLWSANQGTRTLLAALNVVYNEQEERSWFRLLAVTFAFTIAGILLVALAMTALVYVPILFALVGLSDWVQAYVKILRWPLLATVIILGLAFLYKYGPCRRSANWCWVSVGSVVAMVLWLGVSAGFTFYVENFADYNRVYGSLGAVIVLLFWLYLSFLAILLGAEINGELEHHTRYDTTVGEPRPMGERGAYVADHVRKI
jgi:membrane protein